MLVAAPSLALLPEASAALACSRRRWGLAPLGGVHLIGVVLEHGRVNGVGSIGRGPPDQLGLNLPDRV